MTDPGTPSGFMGISISDKLLSLYRVLLCKFGHRSWWPGETPFEVVIGSILTQNTNWSNVEKAVANLKTAGVLEPFALSDLPIERLTELIRPTGYYNQKAKRLKILTNWFIERCCNGETCDSLTTSELREELLSINGVGPETADSILLYALNRPQFVVDAYTHRIFSRLELADSNDSYHQLQSLFMKNLPREIPLYNDYHAQLVELGKRFCRKKPICDPCPVRDTCPYFSKITSQE